MEKINLAQFLAIFGVTGTMLLGAVAYLIKSLTNHLLNKDVERLKIELKSTLEIEKIRYSFLQQKRVDVIAKAYSFLAKFEKSMRDLMALFQPVGELSENEKAKIAAKDGNDFLDYYNENRIYFNKETCLVFDEINEKYKKAWIDFQFKDKIKAEKREDDLYLKSWRTVSEEIPKLREKIEDDFRKIMGVN